MAERERVAWSKCHNCGERVAVKLNVSNRAYYTCEDCGFSAKHTITRSSQAYLQKIGASAPAATPAPAPAPAAEPKNETKPAKKAGFLLD